MIQPATEKFYSAALLSCVFLIAFAVASSNLAFAADPGFESFIQAETLLSQKRPENALRAANEAVRLDPSNAQYYWIQSECLLALDEHEEAMKAINKALQLNRNDSSNWEARASIYGELNKVDAALSDLAMSLKCNPKNSRALGYRARLYLRQGRVTEAESDLTQAIEINPDNITFRADLVNTRMRLGKWKDALANVNTCLKRDLSPKAPYHRQKAVCLEHLNRNEDAAKEFHTALKLTPMDRSLHIEARAFFQKIGDQASVKQEDEFLKKFDSDIMPFEMPKHSSR